MSVLILRATRACMLAVSLLTLSDPALAYVGPGAGLTMIGSLIALVAAAIAGIFGFIWYPAKRLLKRGKKSAQSADEE